MEEWKLERGAETVIRKWIRLKKQERMCIVTSDQHYQEALLLEAAARKTGAAVSLMFVEQEGIHVGTYFDENPNIFNPYDVIIGASDYSILTTKAAERAMEKSKRLLSMPLATTSGESMLGFEFMTADPDWVYARGMQVLKAIPLPRKAHITTRLGTDLWISMNGRTPTVFNGQFWPGHHFSSSSFEICIPILEHCTSGVLVCDGSFSYIGRAREPVRMIFEDGRITEIEDTAEGNRLKEYFESYEDPEMYVAGELGIGLNPKSRCIGECYIEDESCLGTFHLGMGRNIGLGGIHHASGHFDLVTKSPDIEIDGIRIMKEGTFVKHLPAPDEPAEEARMTLMWQ